MEEPRAPCPLDSFPGRIVALVSRNRHPFLLPNTDRGTRCPLTVLHLQRRRALPPSFFANHQHRHVPPPVLVLLGRSNVTRVLAEPRVSRMWLRRRRLTPPNTTHTQSTSGSRSSATATAPPRCTTSLHRRVPRPPWPRSTPFAAPRSTSFAFAPLRCTPASTRTSPSALHDRPAPVPPWSTPLFAPLIKLFPLAGALRVAPLVSPAGSG
jgi:hypothetical protein